MRDQTTRRLAYGGLMAALIALFSLLSDLLCRALDPRVEFS